MFKPRFAIVVGYYVPADGPCDPARHTRKTVAYANTLGWAEILASREFRANFVYGPDESDYDDQGYTEVWDFTTSRRATRPRAVVLSDVDTDIPF